MPLTARLFYCEYGRVVEGGGIFSFQRFDCFLDVIRKFQHPLELLLAQGHT